MAEALLKACLFASSSDTLELASDSDWQVCFAELVRHRVVSHAFFELRRSGFISLVPADYRAAMAGAYLRTLSENRTLFAAIGRILAALAERGIHPVVLKGIAMAGFFFPDPGMRPMGDIDLVVTADEIDQACDALGTVGFHPRADLEGGDAVYLSNESGILCDLHYRVRLFEGQDHLALTTGLKPRDIDLPAITVFEPNAMVVHLVAHMDGHQQKTGLLLGWIVDLAFVLRCWGSALDCDRIRLLMPSGRPMQLFGRLLRFLSDELGEQIPSNLAHLATNAVALPLAQVLRQRRLRPWGLPGLKGWGRLTAGAFGLPLKKRYPELRRDDLLGMAPDAVRDIRSRFCGPGRGDAHPVVTQVP